MDKNTWMIPISGSTGAGKSTALADITEDALERGFYTPTHPETARTMFELQNIKKSPTEFGGLKNYDLQKIFLKKQLFGENLLQEVAELNNADKNLILLDRGVLDQIAYLPDPSLMQKLLDEVNLTYADIYKRYKDGAVIMKTPAYGAEEFYVNDQTRHETLEEARALQDGIEEAYCGVDDVRIIDNSGSWDDKLSRTKAAVFGLMGLESPLKIQHKYLIDTPDQVWLREHARESEIEQYYIYQIPVEDGPEKVLKFRKRTRDNSDLYTFIDTTKVQEHISLEKKKIIGPETYLNMKQMDQISSEIVKKKRYNFVFENQYFQLDQYTDGPLKNTWLLKVNKTDASQEIVLPKFLNVKKEVTGDKTYSGRVMTNKQNEIILQNFANKLAGSQVSLDADFAKHLNEGDNFYDLT